MRFIVIGAGAVGGLVAARLVQHDREVTVVARGEHGDAIAERGLTLLAPEGTIVTRPPVVARVGDLRVTDGDVVVLAVKSQDTAAVLADLAAVAPPTTTIVCAQNGVDNERMALRRFADVYGVCVLVPAGHVTPGVVSVFCEPVSGVFDLGRWPGGTEGRAEWLAAELRACGFAAEPRSDIERLKWGKLLANLNNAIEATCSDFTTATDLFRLVREEGLAVASALGIDAVGGEAVLVERHGLMRPASPEGAVRPGSSTRQSLQRATGQIETDYLNGEVVLAGRLNGILTPANELLQRTADRGARERLGPGFTNSTALLAELAAS